MNQQVRKIIKNSFCPREKWVQDKDASNCFKCDKKFNMITRRKHHCRICGKVFCHPCTEFSLKGSQFGETQATLRMCQPCFKKCQNYIKQHDKQYFKYEKKSTDSNKTYKQQNQEDNIKHRPNRNTKRLSFNTEYDKIKSVKSLIADYELEEPLKASTLRIQVDERISVLIQIMLKQNKIPFSYYSYLQNLVKKVIVDVPPNAIITKNMNICKNIKLRCTKDEDIKNSRYIVGTIIKKSITSKKINNSYENVMVMLVYGNIEVHNIAGKLTFQQIIAQRKNQLIKLVTTIKQFGVSIIFLEKNIDKQALDLFFQNNITVISRVKVENLTRIKISLQIDSVVDGIQRLNEYSKENIVRPCKKLYFDKLLNFQDSIQTILIVEGEKAENGLTILLNGPDQRILKKIKQQIKPIFVIARHFILKMYKVWLDQKLIQTMKPEVKNRFQSEQTANIFFSWFHQKHQNTASYLKQKFLNFKKIVFVESQFTPNSFPEVSKQSIDEYCKSRTRIFKRKWPFFTQICGNFKDEIRRFYSEDDSPMGQYILKKLINHDKKCETCRRPQYQHIQIYYSNNLYVKIQVETRIIEQKKVEDPFDQEKDDLDSVFEQLAKRKQSDKIQCYIECEECHEDLTDKFVVRFEHLELSLLSFLSNLFSATNFSKRNIKYSDNLGICLHQRHCRVFQLGASFLRVSVDFLNLFQPYQIQTSQKIQCIRRKDFQKNIQTCLMQKGKIQNTISYLDQQVKKIGDLAKLTNYESIKKDPKTSFLNAAKTSFNRSSFIGPKNSMIKNEAYAEIIVSKILEYLNRTKQLTIALINTKKIKDFIECLNHSYNLLCILKKISRLIRETKSLLQKKQLNQRYDIQQNIIQQGIFLEEFDMNAMMDERSEFDRSELKDSIHTRELTDKDTDQYTEYNNVTEVDYEENQYQQWMGTQNTQVQEVMSNRKTRKTQSHIITKKQQKNNEYSISQIFKENLTNLKIQLGYFLTFTCNPYHHQSIIASALNSRTHKEILTENKSLQSIKIKFTQGDYECYTEVEEITKILKDIEIEEKRFNIGKQKSPNITAVDLIIYYPTEFEQLRITKKIEIQEYIKTISGSENWIATGGKSGSPFMRAHNDLIVIKKIREREFNTLKKILYKYFEHIKNGSLLTPIYGAYEMIKGNRIDYFIVMQNLFFGMTNWQIYDFKGSRNRRFSRPPVIPLDLNYLLDRNSEPIFTSDHILEKFVSTLNFLVEFNIIDYSLILVINIEDNTSTYMDSSKIRIGIIDYLREFGVGEKIEKVIKGPGCTVVQAEHYKDRMLTSVSRYFTRIPQ